MTLIAGVGDEVVQFAGVVFVLIVAALAWWSTNARPDRYGAVLVMRSRTHHPVMVSIRRRPIPTSSTQVNTSTQASVDGSNSQETIDNNQRDTALQEMDSIVDADVAMMGNNRLYFFRRIESPNTNQSLIENTNDDNEVQTEPEPASTAQIREMDSIVNAMEDDVTTNCDFFNRSNEATRAATSNANENLTKKDEENDSKPSVSNVDTQGNGMSEESLEADQENASIHTEGGDNTTKILIKLKYLNETQKEVEGILDELLKDFKWRHFSSELSAQCRVRLFFNGHALSDDAATLRACGLYDRAVVHCLVSKRTTTVDTQIYQQRDTTEETSANTPHEMIAEGAQPERAWDLENILMTLVSVALTVVWFFRCEYSNMFTASASLALFGLTVFYSVAIFGLYLSDTFHFERRPPQPVPNN